MKAGGGPPRVSVGVAVYNGERFIEQTLTGLLRQTFTDFEIIISDNASTDRTPEICRAFAERDSRIRYSRSDVNRGAAWNHNRVFELAAGEFFKWNSADDVCAPEFLERCVAALDANPSAVMACTDVLQIDEHGAPLSTQLLPEETFHGSAVNRFQRNIRLDHLCVHVYGLFRSGILRQTDLIGPYTDSDRVLLAHLALFGPFVLVRETLLLNRHHAGRSTEQYVGWRSRTAWFDPAAGRRRFYPFWTEQARFWSAVGRSPLGLVDRLRCYKAMLGWAWTYKKHLIYEDLLYYPRQWAVAHVPGAKPAWSWIKAAAAGRAGEQHGSRAN